MLIDKFARKSSLNKAARASLALGTLLSSGCGMINKVAPGPGPHDTRTSYHDTVGMQISYPDVRDCANEVTAAARGSASPLVAEDPAKLPTFDMTLAEAVQMAVRQSPVVRELGGTLVTQPVFSQTIFDPSLAHANPQQGVEAALSAFDTQFSGQLFWNKQDRPGNIAGFGALFQPPVFQGTTSTYQTELSKRTAQGAQFSLRHVTLYDRNNSPVREFSSDFTGWVEAEWRQPLMRGAGTEFNRIAGPSGIVGQYNGVLIARVNEEVALADFEAAVIRLVNDVEQAYWELSANYRVLEASLRGREAALQTFQYQEVRLKVGAGRSDEEAQAQSQFYQFQAQVEQALSGQQGLYASEQRLRYLLGMPPADGRLIKPITEPNDIRVVFDWESALTQALQRRVEIRRQRFNLKRREMELIAARLNRRPQLDFLGNYRWRGLGDNLIGSSGGQLDNLFSEITGGDYQEWQAGMELTFPVGLRAASNAVAHARLAINREQALLNETELRISHSLSDAVRRIGLTHSLLETNYNGFLADLRQVDVLRRRYRDGTDNINFLLQAQRQVVTSEIQFYRSLQDYNLAIRDLHREKGSLLAYSGVTLAEGPWASGAYRDAYELGRFLNTRPNPDAVSVPAPVSSGPFDPSQPQSTSGGVSVVPSGMMIEQEVILPGSLQGPIEPVPAPASQTQSMLPSSSNVLNPMHALPSGETITAEPFQWTPTTVFSPIHVSTSSEMRQATATQP
ncbi:MAG TPA: TolC family protein [Planctomycetaceae bacterium]|nr:TolC family protein [Planctomycetaceae bacterium]